MSCVSDQTRGHRGDEMVSRDGGCVGVLSDGPSARRCQSRPSLECGRGWLGRMLMGQRAINCGVVGESDEKRL
ncbi:hypothetical protein BLNAU_7514 [Blattamonas nauphoetae]|uniref:Uncharacterized protein n=1 Tax=Blattamonas nauphoetae TaxID=2049346 RepID=A0ABQ9Y1J9_9EUKA|nr:hypothetical protein BLNAU_7514 [Blattamonas nauphoetae]